MAATPSAIERLRLIERNLLPLVLATTVVGLAVPEVGQALRPAVAPLLALLMLCVSLTLDARHVGLVLRRPGVQAVATLLVYGPMSLLGWLTGAGFFGGGTLAAGQTLVGVLPTDVSAPLLVLLARGNVALAAVLNAVNTALAPIAVPTLFLLLTGVELEVPVARVVGELLATVLLPTVAGVALRSLFPQGVPRFDPVYSSGSSLAYLALLLAVLGPNAGLIRGYGAFALVLVAAALALNLAGYALGASAGLWTADRGERIAFLFTVSKKEFSIAAALVVTSGLPSEVAVPAVFYAVVQMVTSPLAVRLLTRNTKGP